MGFDWDTRKNSANTSKQDISFEEASAVFDGPRRVEWISSDAADDEERYTTIGRIKTRILAVVYTERNGRLRLISARKASRDERRDYGQS